MAGFHTDTFQVHDDYMTPKKAWEDILHIINKDEYQTIYEPFYGDGTSGQILKELLPSKDIIHLQSNFYDEYKKHSFDIVVTNPPFSDFKNVMATLKQIDKPFMLILPVSKLCTNTIRNEFKDIQIVIPRRRIQFLKMVNGEVDPNQPKKCNFECFYYCYKMNLPHDLMFL